MGNKEIIIVLLDRFADWEAAFLAPALRGGVMPDHPGYCEVKYMTSDGAAVRSLGGMRVTPDQAAGPLPETCAGVVLAGGTSWQTPGAERIVPVVEEALRRGLPVGAICNAASFLAAHGFLNEVRHTGNTAEMLQEWGGEHYTGAARFEERQAVRDGNIVTANGSGFLEFTREYLLALGADTPEAIGAWYEFHKRGFYRA